MALLIHIKVVPQSGRNAWTLYGTDGLKCYLKSPAEQNKANNELITELAQALRIPTSHITIITGATSRTKRVKINTSITFEQVCDALGIERQLLIR